MVLSYAVKPHRHEFPSSEYWLPLCVEGSGLKFEARLCIWCLACILHVFQLIWFFSTSIRNASALNVGRFEFGVLPSCCSLKFAVSDGLGTAFLRDVFFS